MKYALILLMLLTLSCATDTEAKAKFKPCGVSDAKKEWRWCTPKRDGDKADKGLCYIDLHCRKKWGRKLEKRRVPLFCAHGDLTCFRKWGIDRKKIR